MQIMLVNAELAWIWLQLLLVVWAFADLCLFLAVVHIEHVALRL